MNARTRIKICGITRDVDLRDAVHAGADALGFVFYPASPRVVTSDQAASLVAITPPFVSTVGLFVNADPAAVRDVLLRVPLDLLQFHGDEDAAYCNQFGRPWIKALRVKPGIDLLECAERFKTARALLLDAYVDGFGGGGKTFDWGLIPDQLPRNFILSGGLDAENVAAAVRKVCPWAVDVSSGVEADGAQSKGIKDARKIEKFIAGVKNADARQSL